MRRRAGDARVNVRPHATVTAWDGLEASRSMSLVEPCYRVLICSSLESSFRLGPLAVGYPCNKAGSYFTLSDLTRRLSNDTPTRRSTRMYDASVHPLRKTPSQSRSSLQSKRMLT